MEESFNDFCDRISDPRKGHNILYPVNEIILLVLCAVISNCNGWKDIELYGLTKIDFLKTLLPFQQGIPSDDTLRRFFRALDPEAFGLVFVKWARNLSKLPESAVIAIDGKTSRRSFDEESPALHTVSAFASEVGVILGHTGTKGKGQEIKGILELLSIIDIKGSVVTTDAIGTQRKIAKAVVQGGGDYISALKGNQGNMHADVIEFFRNPPSDIETDIEYDKAHGRLEKRVCSIISGKDVTDYIAWPGLSIIIRMERFREIKGTTTAETAYYVTSLKSDAKTIGKKIRAHWGVENSLHHVLDVSFGDDQSRIRKGYAPKNMMTVRQVAINMIKVAKPKGQSIVQTGKRAGWDNGTLQSILHKGYPT